MEIKFDCIWERPFSGAGPYCPDDIKYKHTAVVIGENDFKVSFNAPDSKYYFQRARRLYTGLHDKNGKEYYQFDLFRYGDCTFYIDWNAKQGGWYLYWTDGSLNHMIGEMVASMGENIGNRYENPELLER